MLEKAQIHFHSAVKKGEFGIERQSINKPHMNHFSGFPHRFGSQMSTPDWRVLWQAPFPQVSPGSHQKQRKKR